MTKYKILIIIYLCSVVSSSIANSMGVDVQIIYRVPFLGTRWIDLGILLVIANYFHSFFFKSQGIKSIMLIVPLCFLFLLFEVFQLLITWQVIDAQTQISLFLATLSLFIIIDLSTFKINPEEIILFLQKISVWGAFAIIISNLYLFYSFTTGNVVFQDQDLRVALDVVGSKETVSTSVLTPFVYGFALYFIRKKIKLWEKLVFIAAVLSIYISLVTAFHRGTLFMIAVLTVYIVLSSKKAKQAFSKMLVLGLLLGGCFFLFGNMLREKGYDPIDKIIETANYAADVNNPNWDKGRSGPQEYALDAWSKNIWTGVGYDDLSNYGLPQEYSTAHNGIITSLFHRGVLGTAIFVFILILLYWYSYKLWHSLRKENDEKKDTMRMLIVVAFLWFVPFFTQEVLWEKYSLSIQYLYLGLIINFYRHQVKRK